MQALPPAWTRWATVRKPPAPARSPHRWRPQRRRPEQQRPVCRTCRVTRGWRSQVVIIGNGRFVWIAFWLLYLFYTIFYAFGGLGLVCWFFGMFILGMYYYYLYDLSVYNVLVYSVLDESVSGLSFSFISHSFYGRQHSHYLRTSRTTKNKQKLKSR